MFEFERIQNDIVEHYFKLFKRYNKEQLLKEFIDTWLSLLQAYSKLPDFINFETKIPKLQRIRSPSKTLLIVPFENTEINVYNTTIFPLYPFRVQLKTRSVCCKEGLSLVILYLKITDIKYIGFYKIQNYKRIIKQIKLVNSKIKCYPPSSFKYFLQVNKAINKVI